MYNAHQYMYNQSDVKSYVCVKEIYASDMYEHIKAEKSIMCVCAWCCCCCMAHRWWHHAESYSSQAINAAMYLENKCPVVHKSQASYISFPSYYYMDCLAQITFFSCSGWLKWENRYFCSIDVRNTWTLEKVHVVFTHT